MFVGSPCPVAAVAVLAAASPSPTGTVTLDTSEMPEAQDAYDEIQAAVRPLLVEHEIDPRHVRVKIVWFNANEFQAGIFASVDGRPDPTQGNEALRCPDDAHDVCTPTKLPEYIRLAVLRAIVAKEHAERASLPEPTASGEPSRAPESGSSTARPPPRERAMPRPDDDARIPLGGLGWAGAIAIALGGISAGTGVALVQVGVTRPIDDQQHRIRDFRPWGFALTGVGGGLVLAGVAMLVTDRVRAKRSREHAALRPWLGPTSFGVVGTF